MRKVVCDGCKKEIALGQEPPAEGALDVVTVTASIGKLRAEADACSPACWASALAVASREAQKYAESER